MKTGAWRSDLAVRPWQGHHHASSVYNDKLYLIGGLGGGSEGQVQIYDPLTNSWTFGTPAPYAGGSVAIAALGARIYISGGIVGSATVNSAAVYDPAADIWTTIAPMPAGRNHAAGGSDGKKFFVFGGRTGGNKVSVGYASVQIYDPATNRWVWSGQTGPPFHLCRSGGEAWEKPLSTKVNFTSWAERIHRQEPDRLVGTFITGWTYTIPYRELGDWKPLCQPRDMGFFQWRQMGKFGSPEVASKPAIHRLQCSRYSHGSGFRRIVLLA